MKELSVADSVEASQALGDFVIPLRIGPISFSALPIQVHNKNTIDFTDGWHLGLARLLDKLEKDRVFRSNGNIAPQLSRWARQFLHLNEGVAREDEEVMSTWLPVESLPSTIRISSFSLTPKDVQPFQKQWPCRLIDWRLLSFAGASDFDPPLGMSPLRSDAEIDTTTFLTTGASSLRHLSYQDRANILADLLRQGWEQLAYSKALKPVAFSNNRLGWFVPKPEGKITQVRFNDPLGKSGRRALLGWSEKLKAFWHLALELSPSVGRRHRYTAYTHVIFTSDGVSTIADLDRMHRLRRRFCKLWWQDRWRDLISAYLANLSMGASSLNIAVAPNRAISMGALPSTYVSPIKTVERISTQTNVDEAIDDADLLYDETLEDDGDDDDPDDDVPTAVEATE